MSDIEINILIVVNNSKFDYRIIFLFHIKNIYNFQLMMRTFILYIFYVTYNRLHMICYYDNGNNNSQSHCINLENTT